MRRTITFLSLWAAMGAATGCGSSIGQITAALNSAIKATKNAVSADGNAIAVLFKPAPPTAMSKAPTGTLTIRVLIQETTVNNTNITINNASRPAGATDCASSNLAEGKGTCADDSSGDSFILFCSGGQTYVYDCSQIATGVVCGLDSSGLECVKPSNPTPVDNDCLSYMDTPHNIPSDTGYECGDDDDAKGDCDSSNEHVLFCHGREIYSVDCGVFQSKSGTPWSCGMDSSKNLSCVGGD